MKKSLLILLFTIIASSCGVLRNYTLYEKNIMDDTLSPVTISNYVAFRLCSREVEELSFYLGDIYDFKRSCYTDFNYKDYIKKIVPIAFNKKKCLSQQCDNIKILKIDINSYRKLEKLGVKYILKKYFDNNLISINTLENLKDSQDFFIGLVILFQNHYMINTGSDDYFYLQKAPVNKEMRRKMLIRNKYIESLRYR